MLTAGRFIMLVFLVCIAVYTISFGVWTWKRKNRIGAIMVFFIALITVALPVYTLFIKEV